MKSSRVLALVTVALAGAGVMRVAELGVDAWRGRTEARAATAAEQSPDGVWAAYSGFRAGVMQRGARLVLFAAEAPATEYATRRGLYVTRVSFGERVPQVLSRAEVAPVIQWPGERVDRPP